VLKIPITRVEFFQIEFDPEELKKHSTLSCYADSPSFRRSIKGIWENQILNSWEGIVWDIVYDSTELEKWFKTQNI